MSQLIVHPLTHAEYWTDDDGTIVVRKDDAVGRFTGNGEWIDGELRQADPEMCRWMNSGYVFSRRARASDATEGSSE